MTVLFVDAEHDRVRDDQTLGPPHGAKVETARARLETAAGMPCRALPFAELSLAGVEREAPTAIVIGGSTTDWADYDFAEFAGLLETVRAAPVPILGLCAGHQLIGLAHRAAWGPLGALREGEVDPDPRFAPGQRKQRGFQRVRVDPSCGLFGGLVATATFFHSHYWQLVEVPAGFVARASSPWSPIQAIERLDRPVFGVQFHPERYDVDHPDGATLLRNFFAVIGTDST